MNCFFVLILVPKWLPIEDNHYLCKVNIKYYDYDYCKRKRF